MHTVWLVDVQTKGEGS